MAQLFQNTPWFNELGPDEKQNLISNSRNLVLARNKKDLIVKFFRKSRTFRRRDFNSANELLQTALSYRDEIRHQIENSKKNKIKVTFYSRLQERVSGQLYVHFYELTVEHKGTIFTKQFCIGNGVVSANRMFHAYRTAMCFGKYYSLYGRNFNMQQFENWRNRRLYEVNGGYFQW
ncbi:hypothetical protein BM526_18800 (plasmid) [Alteromonas mediterranea]|uniref:hypothetical protein n=1 Tax=Alteromonas mediterranea TaxID=314275 RepID=UPI0009034FC0|nr:hypothetical protein [Alteromonas mediterranea]APE04020.1 hypothetical protein BM526_18800 [Alteromonas mediterranea]